MEAFGINDDEVVALVHEEILDAIKSNEEHVAFDPKSAL
jgi:hypothetical protein